MEHIPVLLQEVVCGLAPKEGQIILDATVGGGGHSEAICKAMKTGTIVCLDEDEDAIDRSRTRLVSSTGGCGCEFLFCRKNFRRLDEALESFSIREINHALFDLGMSSFHLEESGRGFSFQKDEPLKMSFGKEGGEFTARDIVNKWNEENIATILSAYGEEQQAKRIARAIVDERKKKPIETTGELAKLIERIVRRRGRIHPATKTFQALRIAVNDEFGSLKEAIPKAFSRIKKGGRIAVISFNSLEDRFVKSFFRELKQNNKGVLVTKKPIVPGVNEKKNNPRSRSAKLRIIEKI